MQKWDKVQIENNHLAIIDCETFEKTQQVLKRRSQFHPKRVYSQYLLSGLVFCGRCGYGMIWHTTIILEDIQNHLNNPIEARKIYQRMVSLDRQIDEAALTQKGKQLQDIENRIEKIYDALETGKLPVELISSRLKELAD